MAVYREGRGDSDAEETEAGGLPPLAANDPLDLLKLLAEQHFTEPPPRYGEASLVKALEELGIGRPSTYATILTTLRDRGYVVELKERKFHPTALGRAVNDLLVKSFPELLDVQFTARLEGDLDNVAEGSRQWTPLVAEVYSAMMEKLTQARKEVTKIEVPAETLPIPEKKAARSYRGKTASATGKSWSRSRKPAATTTANLETAAPSRPKTTPARPKAALARSKPTLPDEKTATAVADVATCPLCQKPMVKRKGPYSEFWGCSGYPTCKGTRKL